MKIILTARVSGLGTLGDVVEVRNGYAKNFLIPSKRAICFTSNNQKLFETKRSDFEKINDTNFKTAGDVKNKLIAHNVIIIENASDDGRLYGSVSSASIATKVNEILGEKLVEKTNVFLAKPIKDIGVYSVKIDLHSDVVFSVKLIVSRSESEVDSLIKADEKAKKDSVKETSSKKSEEKKGEEVVDEAAVEAEGEVEKPKAKKAPRKKKAEEAE